ncbi:MAG: type II toxin-antitoxin system RelE/ParE family toxin [Defluviitaleaceae bacterium]|nr:type II toxin-antitoxin system RelE/ParE family toxin [Defluviitaleaceae bacterium]
MAIVTYSEKANNELKNIAIYIAEQSYSIEIALNVVERMRSRIKKRLEIFPYSGRVVETIGGTDYHKVVVERYGFIYKISLDENDEEIVMVMDVIHEAEDDDR